jgi:hypothetical protein
MQKLKDNQRGFGILETVAAVLIVALLGAGGWMVYKHHQDVKVRPSSVALKNQSDTKKDTSRLKIPELKIYITVPASIKDLTYKTTEGKLNNEAQATLAYFSTDSLAKADQKCEASSGPLGALESVTGQYPKDEHQTALNDYGELIKQFKTFYISYYPPQTDCTGSDSGMSSSYKADFQSAFSSIEEYNP